MAGFSAFISELAPPLIKVAQTLVNEGMAGRVGSIEEAARKGSEAAVKAVYKSEMGKVLDPALGEAKKKAVFFVADRMTLSNLQEDVSQGHLSALERFDQGASSPEHQAARDLLPKNIAKHIGIRAQPTLYDQQIAAFRRARGV